MWFQHLIPSMEREVADHGQEGLSTLLECVLVMAAECTRDEYQSHLIPFLRNVFSICNKSIQVSPSGHLLGLYLCRLITKFEFLAHLFLSPSTQTGDCTVAWECGHPHRQDSSKWPTGGHSAPHPRFISNKLISSAGEKERGQKLLVGHWSLDTLQWPMVNDDDRVTGRPLAPEYSVIGWNCNCHFSLSLSLSLFLSLQCCALKAISKVIDDLDDETIKQTVLPKAKLVFTKESDPQVQLEAQVQVELEVTFASSGVLTFTFLSFALFVLCDCQSNLCNCFFFVQVQENALACIIRVLDHLDRSEIESDILPMLLQANLSESGIMMSTASKHRHSFFPFLLSLTLILCMSLSSLAL